jgi:hypothetical protein
MYEAEKPENGFEPETLRRMREVFEGHTCAKCGAAAARLWGGKFFCKEHYPKSEKQHRSPRVYHCQIAAEA